MKTSVKIVFTALISGMVIAPNLVYSHENGIRIHDRLKRQQQRIEQGIDSGALTRKEATVLKKEQHTIRKLTRNSRSDGRLTRAEKAKLNRKLNRAGDHIWNLKHNTWQRKPRYLHSYAYQEPKHSRRDDHSDRIWRRQDQHTGHRSRYSSWH